MNKSNITPLEESIRKERAALSAFLLKVIAPIAHICSEHWDNTDQLDKFLQAAIAHSNNSKLLYAVSCEGKQLSSNVSRKSIDPDKRGQDLAVRPYMQEINAETGFFMLSPVYVDHNDRRLCITAIHKVQDGEGRVLGCVAADYDLDQLPSDSINEKISFPGQWRQIKGDPAIRKNLFQQQRVNSAIDEHLEEVHDIINDLICHRGVFHAKLHYSSSRATLWLYHDPHRYRLHVLEEITDPSVALAYRQSPYPKDAIVAQATIIQVLDRFRQLRDADSTIYLRSASLNIINGMVGLTFSCDGSHYMSAGEFLLKDDSFWGTGSTLEDIA